MYATTIDKCTAMRLELDYSFIKAWNIDAPLYFDDREFGSTGDTTKRSYKKSRSTSLRSKGSRSTDDKPANGTTSTEGGAPHSKRSIPHAQSEARLQTEAPDSLNWLSQLARYSNLKGSYLGFDDYLYDHSPSNSDPIIFIIDADFTEHEVNLQFDLSVQKFDGIRHSFD